MDFFLERGHAVHLILASDRPLTVKLDPRLVLHALPAQSRSWRRFISVIQTRRRLRAILAQSAADILHAHYLTGYGWLARVSGFHPYVITVWGSDVYLTPKVSIVARIWARVALRGADLVTGDSQDLCASAIALGAASTRTRLIQFGVDTSRFRPGLDASAFRTDLGAAGRRIVFVPRAIAPLYRTMTVVRAFRSLPEDCLLVLVEYNHDPSYLAEVRGEVARLGIQDRVRMIPSIDHERMPEAYSAADVVVSIPETDGTPVSILEAMACGRPVVASDLPSVREWLGELVPQALVAVDDADATVSAISWALGLEPAVRGTLGDRLRDAVLQLGDSRQNMLEVEGSYRRLAGK